MQYYAKGRARTRSIRELDVCLRGAKQQYHALLAPAIVYVLQSLRATERLANAGTINDVENVYLKPDGHRVELDAQLSGKVLLDLT